MAYRIQNHVINGEIDNRRRDQVHGRIWVVGNDRPLELVLIGNCLPDLAGCKITFHNLHLDHSGMLPSLTLAPEQKGTVGTMTASRKVFIPAILREQLSDAFQSHQTIPKKIANCLYLEWFSEANGRVVIESTDFAISITDHAWNMTSEEALEQEEMNSLGMSEWMNRINVELTKAANEVNLADISPTPEQLWENLLFESDDHAGKYRELINKYSDHPDASRLIIRELGWTWLEEKIAANDKASPEDKHPRMIDESEPHHPAPTAADTAGELDDHGHAPHPLARQCLEFGFYLRSMSAAVTPPGTDLDPDLHDLIEQTRTAGAKIVGALDHLADLEDMEPGLIVASLKQSLGYLQEAIHALENLSAKGVICAYSDHCRHELNAMREAVINVLEKYRRKSP